MTGANIVVKWLAETNLDLSRLAGAVTVSNPWNLGACCEHLEQSPMGRLYRWAMVSTLKKRGLLLAHRYPQLLCPQKIQDCVTFRDYDSQVTAPLHGFSSADQYYAQCSSAQHLNATRQRLVCLDALDDPFVAAGSLPTRPPRSASFVRPEHGGHLGFIGPGGQLWMEKFICEQVREWI